MRLLLILSFGLIVHGCRAQSPCDSLAAEHVRYTRAIVDQQAQIDTLAAKVQRGTADLDKARKETEILHRIMQGYATALDSLSQSNRELRQQLDELKKEPR